MRSRPEIRSRPRETASPADSPAQRAFVTPCYISVSPEKSTKQIGLREQSNNTSREPRNGENPERPRFWRALLIRESSSLQTGDESPAAHAAKSRSRGYPMPRSKKPIHFEPLTGADAFERLEFFARSFAQGRYNCLVFVGPPGRLKSSIIERSDKDKAHVVSGHATPVRGLLRAPAAPAGQVLLLTTPTACTGRPPGHAF